MKKWVTNLLLIIFCAVFLVSAYFLVDYFLDSRKQQNQFSELTQLIEQAQQTQPTVSEDPVILDPDAPIQEADGPVLVQIADPETGELISILPEYAELYLLNNDFIGWISIEGTNLNYPVMYHPESTDYYLRKDFYEQYSSHGCVYVREACSLDPHSDNVTIYGHNMLDGTMFHALHSYKKQSFWEEHKTITLNTLDEYREYEVMAVLQVDASVTADFQYHLFVDAADETHFAQYVNTCKERAYYDTGVTAEYGDKLITLSTCDRSITNGRLIVVAKLITEE